MLKIQDASFMFSSFSAASKGSFPSGVVPHFLSKVAFGLGINLKCFLRLFFWSFLLGMTAIDSYNTDILLDKFKSEFRFWSMELCIISCKKGESSSCCFPKENSFSFSIWGLRHFSSCLYGHHISHACTIWSWKSRNWSKQAVGASAIADLLKFDDILRDRTRVSIAEASLSAWKRIFYAISRCCAASFHIMWM